MGQGASKEGMRGWLAGRTDGQRGGPEGEITVDGVYRGSFRLEPVNHQMGF